MNSKPSRHVLRSEMYSGVSLISLHPPPPSPLPLAEKETISVSKDELELWKRTVITATAELCGVCKKRSRPLTQGEHDGVLGVSPSSCGPCSLPPRGWQSREPGAPSSRSLWRESQLCCSSAARLSWRLHTSACSSLKWALPPRPSPAVRRP